MESKLHFSFALHVSADSASQIGRSPPRHPVTEIVNLVLEYDGVVDCLKYPVDGVVSTGKFNTRFEENNEHNFREALAPALRPAFTEACQVARQRFPGPANYLFYVPASFAHLSYRAILHRLETDRSVFESPDLLLRTSGTLCGVPQLEKIDHLEWSIRIDSEVHPEIWLQLYVRYDPHLRDYLFTSDVQGRLSSSNSRLQGVITQGLVHITDQVNPACYAAFQLCMTDEHEQASRPRKSKLLAKWM